MYKQCIEEPSNIELKMDLQRIEDNLPLFCVVIAREHAKFEVIFCLLKILIKFFKKI